MPGAQAVAGEEDLGVALALADVVVGTLQQLNGGTGAKVAAADADDHEDIAVGADLLSGTLNPGDLLGGLPDRQIQPAQKIIARTGALGERLMGIKNFLLHCQHIRQGDLPPYMGDIDFNHGKTRLSCFGLCFYITAK